MILKDAVRALRTELGDTQQAFSNRLHIGMATVQRWESGTWKPSQASLHQLALWAQECGKTDIAAAFETELQIDFSPAAMRQWSDVRNRISIARRLLIDGQVETAAKHLAAIENLMRKTLAGQAHAEEKH